MVDESVAEFVPFEVKSILRGRRFTLVGFPSLEANQIARMMQETKSLSFSVNPLEGGPGSETVKGCDLVVLNLIEDLQGSEWLEEGSIALNLKPLLLVGYPLDILDHPALDSAAQEVLLRPFQLEEILFRSYRLLSRVAGARSALGANTKPFRVMLADDDTSITNLLTALLQNHNMECSVVANGEAALHGARRLMPDLMLLDLDMPRMNGFEVLAALRKEPGTHSLKIVLLTGDQDADDIARGSELGADDYILKPFSPGRLVGRIKKLLNPPIPVAMEKLTKVFIR
jgi:DNA-binding response OmpR family regulator